MSTVSRLRPWVLCGGSGTRLWPLSRKSHPKQFVPLLDGDSLLGLTLKRLGSLSDQIGCVASDAHRFLVAEEYRSNGLRGELLLEPEPRNTAAAIALAVALADEDDILLFCPSDHYIPDTDLFVEMVKRGAVLCDHEQLVLFGVKPNHPATGYGYIQAAEGEVLAFVEKPPLERASAMLEEGGYFWNSGIFLGRASAWKYAFQQSAQEVFAACQVSADLMVSEEIGGLTFHRPEPSKFLAVQSVSVDVAVMEKAERLSMVEFSGVWSDLGSWSSLAELLPKDSSGNQSHGRNVLMGCSSVFAHSEARPIVAIDVHNVVVVETPDAILVTSKERAEEVKTAVNTMEHLGWTEATQHRRVARPWGWFDSIDSGDRFQVKRIMVNPGATLSLQMHYHRAEHWVVVRGTAVVTRGDEELLISENQSVFIPLGVRHRLYNPGKTRLELVEVQSGSYLGDDDIVRFEDLYGRVHDQTDESAV